MDATRHRIAAERLTKSVGKCRIQDYELVIDGAMLAVAHWANFTFHSLHLTGEGDDIAHSYFVNPFQRLYFGLASSPCFLDALEELDAMRPLYVRGNVASGSKAAKRARDLLSNVRACASSLIVAHVNRPRS